MTDYPESIRRSMDARRRRIARQQLNHDSGRNAHKRRQRAAIARLKGAPGGWKKALRQIQAAQRAAGARQVPPHRSGGQQ